MAGALLDTNTLRRLASVKISESAVTLARFNEQASQVALGSEDGSVALYSIPNLESLYFGMTDNSEIAGGYFTMTGFSVLTVGGSTAAETNRTVRCCWKKAIEKTILSVLGSGAPRRRRSARPCALARDR
jgi:hypothetical protein